jgi:signal transduction histidine kinase
MKALTRLSDTLRADLWAMAADPLPPMSGPRWLARLPHVLVVGFAALMVLLDQYGHGRDPMIPILALIQSVVLVVAMFRPLAAWWASILSLVIGALAVSMSPGSAPASWTASGKGRVLFDLSFPWSMPSVALQVSVLFLVALRVRPRIASETLAISVLTGLVCVWFVNQGVGPSEIAQAIPFLVTVLIAAALTAAGAARRGLRVARTRLVRQEELTAEEQARRTVLEERNRIARELHDVVAHHMSLISIQAQVAPHLVRDPPPELMENLAGIRENAVEALTELRRVLGVLRSADALADGLRHAPQPTLDRLNELAGNVRGAGLALTIETTGEPRPLSPGVELSAFRIIQEALSNAMRHAPGAVVVVGIGYRLDALIIRIANTAPDRPAPPSRGPGHGLLGMRERTAMLGGELTVGPTAEGGYEVTAILPTGTPLAEPAEDSR